MAEELLINVCPFETRVALAAHGVLQEIHIARASGYSFTGNVYKGRVNRIVPGMQAAFVDIGLKRPGFLHARDIELPGLLTANLNSSVEGGAVATKAPDIRDLLHDGQEILVQVNKDPINSKGARLSTQLAIASRTLVMMPNQDHVGISQRIDDMEERERLRALIVEIAVEHDAHGGFIARTASEGASRDMIASDMLLLRRMWQQLCAKGKTASAPQLIYEELPLHTRVIRDLSHPQLSVILIDHKDTHARIQQYVDEYLPEFSERVQYYAEPRPLFERHGIEDEVNRALDPRVTLRSGGSLVIEQTEAMTTIDVNTGGFVGTHSLEETVYRTNLEAAQCVPRQLRLRNIGGIIVIDFIDMEDEEHQRQVLRALEKACDADGAKMRIEGFSSLGLVQISRKRTRESLSQMLCEPCDQCEGIGRVKTPESTCIDVFRAITRDHQARCGNASSEGEYLIRANEAVVDRLLEEDADHLADLTTGIQRNVRIQMEPSYGPGQFDIVLVQSMRG